MQSAEAVHGQVEEIAGGAVYDAAFFRTYSPTDALQIIELVPGFILDDGDAEIRGFREAAGNVVIDGRRPSSKSEALSTVLARIPAARVARVELVSGDRFGADYAGRALVANIILSDRGGTAANIESTLRREYTGELLPEGSVSAMMRRGPSTFNFGLGVRNRETSDHGYDRVTELPGGEEQEYRIKNTRFRNPAPSASVAWALDEGEHRSAHINTSLNLDYQNLTQDSRVLPRGEAERLEELSQRYAARVAEVSADVTRPLWGGGIKLLGLASRRYRNRDDRASAAELSGAPLETIVQNQRDWREESLARLAWNGPAWTGWTLEVGLEGAMNRLDGRVQLLAIDGNGVATPVDLPVDDMHVREDRAEAFANAGRALSSRLRLDFGVGYEISRLVVSGDVSARRSLRFLKPKVAVDWRAGGWHARAGVERTVSQLNFEDFVSAAELAADRVNSGNPELQPQRAWKFTLSVDKAVLGDGRVKFDLGYDLVSMVQDRVPTPEGFDAPGNLGDGAAFSAVGNIDLPLASVGVKGGRLSLYGSYYDTSVRDPYTHALRPFSNFALFYYEARFRQDLGSFAWGASLVGSTGSDSYRRTEVDFNRGLSPNVSGFLEYRPNARWTLTLGGTNLADGAVIRRRDFYAPDRTSPRPFMREVRYRQSHVVGYLAIKRNIG